MTGSPHIISERDAILAISKYHHPNVTEILDLWIEQESYFTVSYIEMELCNGNLQDFIKGRYDPQSPHPLSESELLDIFTQIMRGIEFIHSQGIVHRNVKPKNSISHLVLADRVLYKLDNEGKYIWKVADFGYSSTPSFSAPNVASLKMNRNYFAPEILLGSTVDYKYDIWSAGCILYELALGHPAFHSVEAIRKCTWTKVTFPLISDVRQEFSKIDEIVRKMLDTSSHMRPDALTVLRLIDKARVSEPSVVHVSRDKINPIVYEGNLGPHRFMAQLEGFDDSVIVETNSSNGAVSSGSNSVGNVALLLAHLANIPKCSIPVCLGFIGNGSEHSLLFKRPHSDSTRFDTLETILHDPTYLTHKVLESPLQKVRVAATLAWTIDTIHNAKYAHRAIGAHKVLISSSPNPVPYLMAFSLSTFQPLTAHVKQTGPSLEWRDRLYQHPDFEFEGNHIYHREYDYYALGVVMLDLGRMQSFALLSGKWKQELENMSAERLQWFRTTRAKELKSSMGEEYVRILLLCVTGEFHGDVAEAFGDSVCVALDKLMSALQHN
jgi:serine/threonine protein kinase